MGTSLHSPEKIARIASGLVFLTGTVVLLGWALDIAALKSVLPGWPPMAPLTAFAFALAGAGLWFAISARASLESKSINLWLSKSLAGIIILLSLLRLSDYVMRWNLGIDLLLFDEPSDISTSAYVAPATAISFLLLGSALLLANTARVIGLFLFLTLTSGLIGWLGFSHYLYGGEALLPHSQMAVHTALTFLVLSAGIFCIRSDGGLLALFVSDSPGGAIARRLVPSALLVPIIFGWLRLQGQHLGWYGTEEGIAILALSNVLVFGSLIWATAALLHRTNKEREQAVEALRQSEALFSTVFRASPVSISISRLSDDQYIDVNTAFLNRHGFAREDVIGKNSLELKIWADPQERARMIERLREQGSIHNFEAQYRRRSGECGVVLVSAEILERNDQKYMLSLGNDITDLKQADEALRESQQHYQTLAESLPNLVWTCNPQGECDYLSRQWVDYTGRPAEEQLGYGWAEQIHPDDRQQVEAAWADAVACGNRFDSEFRIRRADGAFRWFKTRAVPLRNTSGQVVKWFGSNTDFDDYKQAELKLKTQVERLNLLDQITRAIGERQDLQSIFQVVVRSLEDLLPIDFGCVCSYEKLQESLTVVRVGAKSQSLALELAMPEQARVDIDENGLSRCVRGQLVYEPDISQSQYPFPKRLASGGLHSLVIAPLLVESNVFGVLVAARQEPHSFSSSDCEFLRQLSQHVALAANQAQIYSALQQAYNELRQTQHAILQQERLRALGQMASGIAHDINNALSPVALYTESLLERETTLSARARDYLTTIQLAVEDVSQTVSRMREFYRQREPQLTLTPLHLNRIIKQVSDLTRARWSDMAQEHGIVIDLQTELAPDLPSILGVEGEIRDSLTNLILNAVDSMPEGGTLTLRTRAVLDETAFTDNPTHFTHVHLEVCDTGIGMDEETRRRCLEPFFTTKGERGTGLGLAMVYGMAQRQGGEIEIESEIGKGSTIRLIFPVPVQLDTLIVDPLLQAGPAQRLRILIVDDDPLLLKSLGDTLESDGHLVTIADGGQAGIDTFVGAEKRGEKFRVVITDLGMPYVDGRKVASAIKAISPGTSIILLTGWGQRLTAENDVPPYIDHLLNKPPRLTDLRRVLSSCCKQE